MNYKALLTASCITMSCVLSAVLLAGQSESPTSIFTSAQADAGRVAYENTCGQCHTATLMGRKGDGGELPPIKSLSPFYQEFIGPRGFVRPLAGPEFLSRFGSKTASELIARFQETVTAFPPKGMNDETTVHIVAYVLQVNGAKAGTQPLTRKTGAVVNSTIR